MKDAGSSYVKIWEFRVKRGEENHFEHIYGPEGDWNQLMKKADGFMNTQLLSDVINPGRFVTIDYWSSVEAYEKFMGELAAEYNALDEKCESLTEEEKSLGSFSLA